MDKIKLMIISKDYILYDHFNINENHIERTHKYTYLVPTSMTSGITNRRCWIEKSRAFNGMINILKNLSMDIILPKYYVFSALYYKVES